MENHGYTLVLMGCENFVLLALYARKEGREKGGVHFTVKVQWDDVSVGKKIPADSVAETPSISCVRRHCE